MDDSQTHESSKNGDEDSDDSDDDDINVVIGDIKSGSAYNMKVDTFKNNLL